MPIPPDCAARWRPRGLRNIFAVLGLLCVLGQGQAGASPIRPRAAWARGDAPWPRAIRIPSGIRLVSVDGLLPQTPFVGYLHWRRSLAPARFDRYHPRVGPMLALDTWLRANPPAAPAPPTPPVPSAQEVIPPPADPGRPIVPVPQPTPLPQQTPEPPTALIALALMGSGALARRHAPRRA